MPMVYFKEDYNFPRFQRGSNIFSRGVQLFLGGGGGSNCLFPIKSHITCISRGVQAPCPPLDQCMQYFALKKVSCEKKLSILTPPPPTQGRYFNFFRIRRLGSSIYRSPKKKSGISSTPKKYLKF